MAVDSPASVGRLQATPEDESSWASSEEFDRLVLEKGWPAGAQKATTLAVGTAANSSSSPKPARLLKDLLWVQRLRSAVGEGTEMAATLASSEADTQEHLRAILEAQSPAPDEDAIPVFFKQRPAQGSMASRTRRLACLKFLKKQAEQLLDQRELEALWGCLRENRTPPDDENAVERINYDDFTHVSVLCEDRIGPKTKRFFTAATFLTFEADDHGRIAILPFYLYVMRWVSITQTRINMCILDTDGDGYLLPQEMEAYIRQVVPTMYHLKGIEPSFLPLYCRIATKKFLFFCDLQRRGKLLIREVLLSPVLSELMELRQDEETGMEGVNLADNWFTLSNAKRVYHLFVGLDVDRNGTLNKQELQMFGDDNLTDIFIDRVFDEQMRRRKGERGNAREMDLNNFTDLVLALENRHTPEGLAYIFRCLDIRGKGQLSITDVYTLFRSVHKRWMEGGNYELLIEDVKDEIWDMVKPQNRLFLTLDDLVQCQQGHTVVSMLIDVGGFWAHDNRETLVAQQDAEGAQ